MARGLCRVTRENVPNPPKPAMWLDLKCKRMQAGNTITMIFSMARIVSDCSPSMTLLPGDGVTTGTPPGVGLGMKPPL
ncbi:MAG: fumarylacetoacetate hydrolase family protein [Polaromonas sp.]|uniref:fumarylacetoacetate hydrolase family protein n=1 Tax=Polaromonas sp. TaxID=1869339 RepID=UPI004036151D